jgi:nitrite reductase (NADH) small subunit
MVARGVVETDKPGLQPPFARWILVTQGDALGWDNVAPLALERRGSDTMEKIVQEHTGMPEMVRVCDERDLPKEGNVCEVAGGNLCVARIGGRISVISNHCPHSGGPLGQGMVEDGKVICPLHGWAFDVGTGATDEDDALRVHVFEAEVRDSGLFVRPPERAG